MSKESPAVEALDKEEQLQADADLEWLMDQPQGRRFIGRLIDACRVNGQCNTGNSHTFTLLGRRDVGLFFMGELERVCPEKYIEMYRERILQARQAEQLAETEAMKEESDD